GRGGKKGGWGRDEKPISPGACRRSCTRPCPARPRPASSARPPEACRARSRREASHPMPPSSHPPIRRFVLRQGRVSNAQRRAVDTLLSVYGIAYAPGALDFEQIFGRRAPTILEIGFGMGETTAR